MEVEIGLTVEQWNVVSYIVFEVLIGVVLMTTIVEVSAFFASRQLAKGQSVRPNCTIASRVFAVDTLYLPASLGWRGLACVLAVGGILQGLHILAGAGVGARVKYGNSNSTSVFLPNPPINKFESSQGPVEKLKAHIQCRPLFNHCGTAAICTCYVA